MSNPMRRESHIILLGLLLTGLTPAWAGSPSIDRNQATEQSACAVPNETESPAQDCGQMSGQALLAELQSSRRTIEALQQRSLDSKDSNEAAELRKQQIAILERTTGLLHEWNRRQGTANSTVGGRVQIGQFLNPAAFREESVPVSPHGEPRASDRDREQPSAEVGLGNPHVPQRDVVVAAADEPLQKQVELQRKQIELLENMVRLLKDQIDKQSPAIAQLQTMTAELEGRSKQAASRDQQLANGLDDVVEHMDAEERYGPRLPAQLHEMFLPSGNNETPLSIFGAFAFGLSKMEGQPGGFYFGEFSPDFLLKLNDWIFLEAEIGVGDNGSVDATFAQADFLVNDWLTIVAGRFVSPLGWYNERLNNPWINKLPGDAPGGGPLPFLQVLPTFSMIGVQARGSFYLGRSPFKMEYAAFISNGLNVAPATSGSPTIDELANIENMTNTYNFTTTEKAVGGRIGLWWPEAGLEAGISGMYNGDYISGGSENSISLWALDLNYRKGNWDARAEFATTYQQARPFLSNDIRREGMYAQLAYRPRDAVNKYVQNTELVYRFGYVNFHGIDAASLDFTTYDTSIDVPIRRTQHEIGVNYYFYPRMVLKCAYQINNQPGVDLHDNQFISELAWGW